MANPMTPTTTTQASQSAVPTAPSGPTRSRNPRSDWLDVPPLGPSRLGSCSAPPQNANDACGSSTNVPRVTAAAAPTAQAASRHRRLTR